MHGAHHGIIPFMRFLVESGGKVTLGPIYGTVLVEGLTYEEARERIEQSLKSLLPNPEVVVQSTQPRIELDPNDVYKVEPDGTITLNRFGAVSIAGKTLAEANRAIEDHLSWYFDSPQVGIEVLKSNSKYYYVILGSLSPNNMVRIPISGNETVLDAIGQIRGFTQFSSKTMWIARPAPAGIGQEQILPIDWDAVGARRHYGHQLPNYARRPHLCRRRQTLSAEKLYRQGCQSF